jgi:type IV pilus assembly protein PilM
MPQVVGLDIGTSAVRAAELEMGKGAPALIAFGQVGLPPGTVVDGEVRDISAISNAIERLWQNGKFTSKSVVVGIAGLRAITRELDLPYVPDNEVDSAVRFQSEEVIPFPPDKTILSAQVLADYKTADGSAARRVLVAAAHHELVDGVVQAVERAGLHVEGVDLVSSALVRALVDRKDISDHPEAIVSVGAGLTVVVVHQSGMPQFVRTIGTGGNASTAAIASALDLPLVDAEAIKRRLGEHIPQVESAERAVQSSIFEIVTEIRNSIQYFATLPGREPIARVMVTGGGSQLRGLLDQLRTQVRIPVEAISPLARLDLSSLDLQPDQASSIDPVLATPIGLALPEPNTSVRKFNLVPPEILKRNFERKMVRYAFMGAAVVAVLVLGVSAWRYLSVRSASNSVNTLTASVHQFNAEIPTFDSALAASNEVKTTNAHAKTLSDATVDWSAVLSQLDANTPAGLDVTDFTGTGSTTAAAAAAGASSTPGATAAPGAIGSFSATVSGSFPGTAHFSPVAEWIDNITGVTMFSPPGVSAVTNTPVGGNTTVTFQSTVSLGHDASLSKNGHS